MCGLENVKLFFLLLYLPYFKHYFMIVAYFLRVFCLFLMIKSADQQQNDTGSETDVALRGLHSAQRLEI